VPVIVVAGEPGAGATTVAVGLAHRIAHAGREVRLARIDGDERAVTDAATFGALEFAEAVEGPVADGHPGAGDAVVIVEAPAGADASALAAQFGARLVRVARAEAGGDAGATANGAMHVATHARASGPLQIAEDRVLAAPTVGLLVEASRARVLVRSIEGDAAICEHIVVGAIASDAAEPYFARYPRSAVVTRAEKVDVALAAMRTDPACLILSGGADPSPYLLDRVGASRGTTVLLAPEGTVETVRDIEGGFGRSPFSHEAKVERIGELMAEAVDDATLGVLLGA
jgi:BioD-like phosphotransacetylase family protein